MRNIIFLLSFLAFQGSALAEPKSDYLFQATTQTISQAQKFWGSFWEILAGRAPLAADLSVKVTNATTGAALKNATVMVGMQKGNPFAENILKTDEAGIAQFTDEKLKGGIGNTITAAFPGFGTATLFAVTENSVEIALQPLPRENSYSFFQGRLTGFPPGYNRRTMELGIFMPAMRMSSLLNFDPQEFVSSYTVDIDLYGKRAVPGNVVFPPQDKSYGIIPIHLEKTEFIMPIMNGVETHMAATLGAVDISTAVKAMKTKDFMGMLNATNLTHVGWSNRIRVRGNERFDINARHQLRQAAITTQISGVPQNLDLLSVSLFDPEGDKGDFVPLDIKSIRAEDVKGGNGSLKLSILDQRNLQDSYYVFTGVFKSAEFESREHAMVGSLQPVNESKLSAKFNGFLQTINGLSVGASNRDFRFTSAENNKAKLTPNLTILNIISEKKNPATKGILRSVLWTAIFPASVERITLPDLGKPVLPNPDREKEENFLWEVIAVKAGDEAAKGEGLDVQSALRNVQHVSTLTKSF